MKNETVTVMTRLDGNVYAQLVKQLPPPQVTEATTAHHAGYLLGIQLVLSKLREGYVISPG